MKDAATLLALAERLEKARCWHTSDAPPGSRIPASKWFDLQPFDVREAATIIRAHAAIAGGE